MRDFEILRGGTYVYRWHLPPGAGHFCTIYDHSPASGVHLPVLGTLPLV